MNFFKVTSILSLFALCGCNSVNSGNKLFEYSVNSVVGYPIYDMKIDWKEINQTEEGNLEYVTEEENGCTIALICDNDGIVLGWRYLSDPSLCQRTFSFGPW